MSSTSTASTNPAAAAVPHRAAPVRSAARRRPVVPAGHDGSVTQFSLFGAEASAPALTDLDGLLLAGGHWVLHGTQARLSVVVAERWRADALAAAFAERGVDGPDAVVPAEAGFAVRTAFTGDLLS